MDRQIDRQINTQIDSRAMAATRNQTTYDKEIVHRQLYIETTAKRQIDGWEIDIDRQIDRQMVGWIDRWMDGQIDAHIDSRAMAETRNQTRDGKEIVHRQLLIEISDIEQQKEIGRWEIDKRQVDEQQSNGSKDKIQRQLAQSSSKIQIDGWMGDREIDRQQSNGSNQKLDKTWQRDSAWIAVYRDYC